MTNKPVSNLTTCRCQLCGGVAYLISCEPDFNHEAHEWRSFSCPSCGPIRETLSRVDADFQPQATLQ